MPHERKKPRMRLLVNASLGLGKTSAVLAAVAEITDRITVALLVPSLQKAEEAAADYNRLRQPTSLPVQVFRGRGADNAAAKEEKMCQRHKTAEAVAKAGLGVESTLCTTCPHRHSTCAYQKQVNLLHRRERLIIATHEHLFLAAIPTHVDLLIIDESVAMKAADTHRFSLERITGCLPTQATTKHAQKTQETLQTLFNVFSVSQHGQHLTLLQAICSKRGIIAARRFLEKNSAGLQARINGEMDDAQIIESLAGMESSAAPVISLLRQIEREWKTGRDGFNSIVIQDMGIGQRQVTVHGLKRPLLARAAPLLLLDGTASLTLNRKLFGDDLEYCEFRVERDAEVMQTSGKGFSRQSITGKKMDGSAITPTRPAEAEKLRQHIAAYINSLPHQSLLVLINKTAKEMLHPLLAGHVATAHFNAVRGINAYENCEAAVCIGREQPAVSAVEDIARAYAATDAEPFFSMLDNSGESNSGYVTATRGIRRPDNKVSPIEVAIHPHPIAQEVLEQIREAEIVQAVDRIRPIHNRRHIYLLNSIAADITVFTVTPWKDLTASGILRLRQAAMRGAAVPCSAAEMTRIYPDLWASTKIAENDLQRTLKYQIESLFGDWGFIAVEYKRLIKNGKYYAAWAKRDNPREALEHVVGKVAAFRLVEP